MFSLCPHKKVLPKCESQISFCGLFYYFAEFMYFSGILVRSNNGVELFGFIGCNDNQPPHNLDLN